MERWPGSRAIASAARTSRPIWRHETCRGRPRDPTGFAYAIGRAGLVRLQNETPVADGVHKSFLGILGVGNETDSSQQRP